MIVCWTPVHWYSRVAIHWIHVVDSEFIDERVVESAIVCTHDFISSAYSCIFNPLLTKREKARAKNVRSRLLESVASTHTRTTNTLAPPPAPSPSTLSIIDDPILSPVSYSPLPLLFIRLKEKLISLLNPSVLGTIHYNEIDCGNILNPLFSALRLLPPSSFVLLAVCTYVHSFVYFQWSTW